MKRCPKCNRTFPDENQKFCTVDGGLLIGAPAFDPNVTMRATSAELGVNTAEVPQDRGATSRELPDPNVTMAASSFAPTATFPRSAKTSTTSSELTAPPEVLAPPDVAATPPAAPQKKSKLPWIIGGLLVVLLLGIGGAAAAFFFVIKPMIDERQRGPETVEQKPPVETTPSLGTVEPSPAVEEATPAVEPFEPPANAAKFTNSQATLDGKLAEYYNDFSFYYPNSWRVDPKAGIAGAANFAKVEKTLDDQTGEYLLESATFSWYTSNGTFDSDLSIFPERVSSLSSQISRGLPGYKKVSEGETQVNSLRGYEFRFEGVFLNTGKGDLPYWGRAIFIPSGVEGRNGGVVLILLATSLASDLSSVSDVGEKGEAPLILESFRFEASASD